MAELKLKHCKSKSKAPSKGSNLSTKCAKLVKQQRARIYILRRCATMLLCCWYCWVMGWIVVFISYYSFLVHFLYFGPWWTDPPGFWRRGEISDHNSAFSPTGYQHGN